MKSLGLAFTAAAFSLSSFAASFQFISLPKLRSKELSTFGKVAIALQESSEALPSSSDVRLLESKIVKITPSVGQTELKMVRQLLRVDFNCSGETYVNAEKSDRRMIKNFHKAFVSDSVDETSDYLRSVEALEAALLKSLKGNRDLEVYDVDYSGGGSCEFGKDGIILLDKRRSEALFLYSQWSS